MTAPDFAAILTARDRFGPQTSTIEALLARAATLTEDEARTLDEAMTLDAARVAWDALDAARDACWSATWVASRAATWDALDACWSAIWVASWAATWVAAWDAVAALLVRDLIGKHGFTQDHYDLLARPWVTVIGPVHPDDEVTS